jgi:hypothetical protein
MSSRKAALVLLLGLLFFVLSFIILPEIRDRQVTERARNYALQTVALTGQFPSDSEIKQNIIRARQSVSYLVFFERVLSLTEGVCLGWATADVVRSKKPKDQRQ